MSNKAINLRHQLRSFTLIELLACPPKLPAQTGQGRRGRRSSFTLIELLVVIAIIAILASLLMPALSRAKYQAMIVTCLNNQRQVAISATLFESDNDNQFPKRVGNLTPDWPTPDALRHSVSGRTFDARSQIREMYDFDVLQCPFHDSLDFSNTSAKAKILHSYEFYAGWELSKASHSIIKSERMHNLSTNMTLVTAVGTTEFDILVADYGMIRDKGDSTSVAGGSHPDWGGLMSRVRQDDSSYCQSFYQLSGLVYRGPVDRNFTRTDGSGFTVRNITYNDTRLKKTPYKRALPGKIDTQYRLLPSVDF